MTPAEHAKNIADLIAAHKYDQSTEDALQRGIEQVLIESGEPYYYREYPLPGRGRADLLIHRNHCGLRANISIECKIKGSLADLTRQLDMYADCHFIDALILVTTKTQLAGVPRELRGKPVEVVCLMDAFA